MSITIPRHKLYSSKEKQRHNYALVGYEAVAVAMGIRDPNGYPAPGIVLDKTISLMKELGFSDDNSEKFLDSAHYYKITKNTALGDACKLTISLCK